MLNVVLAVAVLLLLFLAVGPHLLPYRPVTMLTGSMAPEIPAGSMVVDVAKPTSALRVGDVVTFHAPVTGRPVVTHRVVSVDRQDGRTLIRTRGDANSGLDPWTAVVHGDTVWQVRAVIPHLGDAVRLLRTAQAHRWVVWIAPAVVLAWFLAGVWRRRPESVEGGEPPWEPFPDEPAAPSLSSPASSRPRVSEPQRGGRRRPLGRRRSQRRPRHSNRRSPSR
jgi:signal peptidase